MISSLAARLAGRGHQVAFLKTPLPPTPLLPPPRQRRHPRGMSRPGNLSRVFSSAASSLRCPASCGQRFNPRQRRRHAWGPARIAADVPVLRGDHTRKALTYRAWIAGEAAFASRRAVYREVGQCFSRQRLVGTGAPQRRAHMSSRCCGCPQARPASPSRGRSRQAR